MNVVHNYVCILEACFYPKQQKMLWTSEKLLAIFTERTPHFSQSDLAEDSKLFSQIAHVFFFFTSKRSLLRGVWNEVSLLCLFV